jgi:hypothetical protein
MTITAEELNRLLEELTPWLYKRSAFEARRVRGLEANELFQATALRFLERARSGWFDQAPTTSLTAQARALLWYCMRQELTAIYHRRARTDLVDPGTYFVGLGTDPELGHIDEQTLIELVLSEMECVSTPACRLSLLSRDVPWLVVLRHIEQAKAQSSGGSSMVVRAAAEALELLRESLPLYAMADDVRTWALELGAIWFGTGPLDQVSEDVRRDGATKVERYARRALRALAAYFGSKQGIK